MKYGRFFLWLANQGMIRQCFIYPLGCGSIRGVQKLDKCEREYYLRGTKPAELRILGECEVEALEPKGHNQDRNR